jgi:hypothetical protein
VNPGAQWAPPASRDRAVARVRRLVTGVALVGLAGIVGFGYLAAATVPGKSEPKTASSIDATGPVGGSDPAPTAAPRQGPTFQAPAQAPFSVGRGHVTTGGS